MPPACAQPLTVTLPDGRRLAAVIVAISMASFVILYLQAGSPAPLRRIAMVDIAGLPILALAAYLGFR